MKKDYIVVTIARNTKKKIFLEDIIYLIADGSYTKIYFTNNKNIILSRILKTFDYLCDKFNFFRVNRTYIINLDYAYELISANPNYILMADNKKINIYGKKYALLLKKEFS